MNRQHSRAVRAKGFASGLLLCCALTSSSALGQPAAQDKAAAEALFQQGVAHIEAGELDKGCAKLSASQKLDPAAGTALRLGDCYERLGRTASAWAMFAEASSIAEREGQAARKQVADLRVAALVPQLFTLTVKLEVSAPDGLVVLRDGVPLPPAVWATAVPLDPGAHVIEASAPGHETWTTKIELGSAARAAVVSIPALAKRPEPSRPAGGSSEAGGPGAPLRAGAGGSSNSETAEDPGGPIRVTGFVVGGLGLAGVVVGSVLGLTANSSNEDSLEHCRTETFCSDEGIALRETAKEQATVSTVGFVAGGALLVAGLVMVLAAPSAPEPEQTASAGRWALAPQLGLGEVGLGVETRW